MMEPKCGFVVHLPLSNTLNNNNNNNNMNDMDEYERKQLAS